MSVHFTRASTQYLTRTASALDYNAAYTMLGWARFDTLAANMHILSIGGASAGADYDSILWLLSSTFLGLRVSVASTPTTTTNQTLSADTWYCWALRRTSATALELWLGTTPANLALVVTVTTDVSARNASTQMRLGIVGTTTNPLDGDLAAVKAWQSALTEAEMKTELGYFPAVKASPWGVWKLLAHTDLTDSSGNGRDWTAANGPLTTSDDPPGVSTTLGQSIVPNATVAAGSWVDNGGGSTDLHTPLADENTTTYVQSPANPTNAQVLKLGLSDISMPAAGDVVFEIDAEQV